MKTKLHKGLILFMLGLALAGCSTTVTPQQVKSNEASFDGNVQNSGILGDWDGVVFVPDTGVAIARPDYIPADAPKGLYVTENFRNRYNALVKAYGKRIMPPLKKDDGMTAVGNVWCIDYEHIVHMRLMNSWRKAGQTK